MKNKFELFKISRKNYLNLIEEHTLDQLNTVPSEFKNNLIWNAAHVIASTDGLFNRLHGLHMRMTSEYIQSYAKGSRPEIAVNQEFVDQIKKDLIQQVSWVESDFEEGKFPESTIQPYTTTYGNTLVDFESVLAFNLLHEGLHYGIMLSLKKFI